jgi:hypothetical protein
MMRTLGSFRGRTLLVVVIAAAMSIAALGTRHSSSEAARSPSDLAERLVLRLHDLPVGYRLLEGAAEFPFSGIDCHSIEPANPQPHLAAFLDRYSPAGCLGVYLRLFRIPGSGPSPLVTGTGAFSTQSVEEAEAGLAISPELISHVTLDEPPEEVSSPTTIGEASRLFHWDHPGLFGAGDRFNSFLVWRSGDVVAAVFVAGGTSSSASDRNAFELARLQQRHIETPTPYTQAERDGREVALEDPALDVPVYWLGRRLAPRRGLRQLLLVNAASTTGRAPRVPRVNILYSDRFNLNHAEGVNLNLWSSRQWKQLMARRGKLPASLPCENATAGRVSLPHGRAVIYSGSEASGGKCPRHGDPSYAARVYLGRVVLTAETMSICASCAGPGSGGYDSLAGMRAIVRSLARRVVTAGSPGGS